MHRIIGLAIATLAFLTLAAPQSSAMPVTVPVAKDNTIYGGASVDSSNGAGDHMFAGTTASGEPRRALIKFDVEGALSAFGAGVTVDSVVVRMFMSRTLFGTTDVSMHRLTADWGEEASHAAGNEGGGDTALPGDATWEDRFFPGTPWASDGGDFVAGASATTNVGPIAFYEWTGADLAADVNAWIADPSSNHGWILIANEAASFTARRFDTHENPNPGNRPVLELFVSFPTAAGAPGIGAVTLHPAVPNPFNPSTTIPFTLREAGHVTVSIYNVSGARVTTLQDGVLPAGDHSVQWFGQDAAGNVLGSGVYFVNVRAAGEALTRKITLIK